MDTVLSPLDFRLADRVDQSGTGSARQAARVCLRTITSRSDFEALRPHWLELFETCGRPPQVFQSFDWLAIWASLFVDHATRLSIVVGEVDGKLVFVWPLVTHYWLGLRILCGMGAPLSQYDDALMSPDLDEADEDAIFNHVTGMSADVFSLRRVRVDAAVAPMLRRRLGPPSNLEASPVVDFIDAPSVEAFEARFPSKVRSSRRRRRRRLEERGAVTFTHHEPSLTAAGLAATALRFKRDWARQVGVLSPSLRDPRFERFFIAAAGPNVAGSPLRVSALRNGEEIVGVEMSVLCKGHLIGHVLAPKPGLPQLGLGSLLAEATILNARQQGYLSIDLLAPADPYKLEWTSASVEVGDYCVARNGLGALYVRLWLRHGRPALKGLMRRCRPILSRVAW